VALSDALPGRLKSQRKRTWAWSWTVLKWAHSGRNFEVLTLGLIVLETKEKKSTRCHRSAGEWRGGSVTAVTAHKSVVGSKASAAECRSFV